MAESKSAALPLGDAPTRGAGQNRDANGADHSVGEPLAQPISRGKKAREPGCLVLRMRYGWRRAARIGHVWRGPERWFSGERSIFTPC